MFSDNQEFNRDPRGFALALVEEELVDAQTLLECALAYMSTDDVRDMLDKNELSPRFSSDYTEDDDYDDSMDGDFDSAMSSAGFGMDEDY